MEEERRQKDWTEDEKSPILLVMAAGMGSRYGGLKQVDPLGPGGELILDYSLYDARRAGFRRAVFIIKKENQALFEEMLTSHLPADIDYRFAYQEMDDLPEPYKSDIPLEREKPWGTAHAVYSARRYLNAPFAVVNADDYYGPQAFRQMGDFLREKRDSNQYAMVAFYLNNTLTENGSVSRGICTIHEGKLKDVHEITAVEKDGKNARYQEGGDSHYHFLPGETPVSMNFWGFQPSIIPAIEEDIGRFFREVAVDNPLKAEYYLPAVVSHLLRQGRAEVSCFISSDQWMGVTYKEDKEGVQQGFKHLADIGRYPLPLWKMDQQ